MQQDLREYEKAKECYKKALTFAVEICNRDLELSILGNLGKLFYSLGEHVMAERYLLRALLISLETGNADKEFSCYCNLTMVMLSQGKIREAFDYLVLSFNKSENLRVFMRDNDEFKIAFSDVHEFPYCHLSAFLCSIEIPNDALYVLELARGKALADLMATQYSIEMQISANPQSWIGIENIMKRELTVLVFIFLVMIKSCYRGSSRQAESFISEE